jgi:hypothetical protein
MNFQIVGILALVIYILGIWRFLAGFRNTFYTSNGFVLALLWPLLIFNGKYRQEFFKALKG